MIGLRLSAKGEPCDGFHGLMIDQPEIGVLGFVLREARQGFQWLAQAKAEPGNVGGVHIAPTVQATHSNIIRRHGGAPTRYLEHMPPADGGQDTLANVLQSEQGTMFFNKYNRNVAVLHECPAADARWRWCASAEIRALLRRDHAVNSDARSVIVCTPWRHLSDNGRPFDQGGDTWVQRLRASYADDDCTPALGWLSRARGQIGFTAQKVALHHLPGVVIAAKQIEFSPQARVVRPYQVEAPDREVSCWSQPLLERNGQDRAALICAHRNGVLKFYLRGSLEPGFLNHVQFGPSQQSDTLRPSPRWVDQACAGPGAIERAVLTQSDEGGRFMACVTRYAVIEIDAHAARDDDEGCWVGLGAIERLAGLPGALTNEARTLVSLLVSWA